MFTKCFSVTSWVMIASLLALAACTPATGSEGMSVQNNQGTVQSNQGNVAPSSKIDPLSIQTPTRSAGVITLNNQGTEVVSSNTENSSNL